MLKHGELKHGELKHGELKHGERQLSLLGLKSEVSRCFQMKNKDIDQSELTKAKLLLTKVGECLSELESVAQSVIDDQLAGEIRQTRGVLYYAVDVLNTKIKNPMILAIKEHGANAINISKLLDNGEALKFYNKYSEHKTHNGLVSIDNLIDLGKRFTDKAKDHVQEIEQQTNPSI